MSNNNALTVTAPTMQEVFRIAEDFAKSGRFPDDRSASQAVVKILAGRELGFLPFASMVNIHIIDGKPSIGAHLMAAAIKRSERYDYKVIHLDRERCELEFYERGQPVGRVAMSMQEAVDCGLAVRKHKGTGEWVLDREGQPVLRDNWKTSGDDMLFARCISKGYRRYCPDLLAGMTVYTQEEMDGELAPAIAPAPASAVNAPVPASGVAGEIVDAEFTVVPPNGEAEPPPAPVSPFDDKPEPMAGPLTDATRDRIVELLAGLKTNDRIIHERLQINFGVERISDLTEAQGLDLIGKLYKSAAVKRAPTVPLQPVS